MSGKPEGRTGPPGLQNVVVYVSSEGFYTSNGRSGSTYTTAPAVRPQYQQQSKLPSLQQQHPFYNVQQQQNEIQCSASNYNGPRIRTNTLQREDSYSLMGGDGIGGNVFLRCSEAQSSCSSLSSVSDQLESVGGNSVRTYKAVGSASDRSASIAVPVGWKRLHTNGTIIYVSPSNTALNSIEQVKNYLQTQGTCKCGLECPLNCDIVFNFDPKVLTRPWSGGSIPVGDLTKLCNHKRKQLTMATSLDQQLDMKREGIKKKKRKIAGSYGTASVSQLLAQREKDRSKDVHHPQSWSEVTNQVRKDGSPMLNMQPQIPQVIRSNYPAVYNNKSTNPNTQQFYRHNSHNGCMPQETLIETLNGSGADNNYLSPDTNYIPQQTCSGLVNSAMMMNQQYQYHPRTFQGPENQNIDHHCHQKLQNPSQQVMMHQQQQPYQHQQLNQTHLPQNMIQRPQVSHNMQLHPMMAGQQGHALHQHYDRMIVPTTQFQYSNQEHKTMQLMAAQHQLCVNKSQIPKREVYQRSEIPPLHQIHQGMVLQTSQGQVMLPQQAMVLHQQAQHDNSPMQFSQNQSTIQGSEMAVQNSNPSVHHNYQPNNLQVMLHQPSSHGHHNTHVQLPNQRPLVLQNNQQSINHAQSDSINNNNDNNNLFPSSALVMHQQRPTPPWHTNRNNHIINQSIPVNQQPNNNLQQSPHPVQQNMHTNVYDRVPPLHHHLPSTSVWNEDRKKNITKNQGKPTVNLKNKRLYSGDQQLHSINSSNEQCCPNVDVRQLPQSSQSQSFSNTNIPSFMEDPSGYLAQQTALLNSTISRQTGINNKGINIICQTTCNPQTNNQNTSQGGVVLGMSASSSPTGSLAVPIYSNSIVPKQNFITRVSTNQVNNSSKPFRSNSVSSSEYQNQIHTVAGVADSSRVSPDGGKCSQDCVSSVANNTNHLKNQNQSHSVQNHVTIKFQPDDNPVTSSTFMENHQQVKLVSKYDSGGPIQGGAISTSNRSPSETLSRIPPDGSSPVRTPTPTSTHSGRIESSPESSIFISTASPFTITNSNTIIYHEQEPTYTSLSRSEASTSIEHSPKAQQINLVTQDVQMCRIPTIVTTMASGHTVSSNTITSVLAGRANTATVSINNQTSVAPPTVSSTVLTNQSIPLVSISKSPLEMVQSVVSSIQVPVCSAESVLKPATAPTLPTGHILMSTNGQLLVTNTQGQPSLLSPQQNLTKINTSMPPMSAASSIVTSATGTVTQVIPAVGVTQQVLGQPTVLVNTLPTPLLFQPSVMTMDGTMNTVQIPHLAVATGSVLPGQMVDEARVTNNGNGAFSPRNQPPLLSPDGINSKRKGNVKKRKVSPTVASMLHIAAQQNSPPAGATGMVVQQQQPQQNFNPPMLQALTILPSKAGHFGGTQQLIATGNILQPLNLVQNFPTIQQFIVPAGLGGMVMATGDGTATLLQDTVQLNVLTPMQGPGGTVFGHTGGQSILAASPAGMVIRAPTTSNQQTAKVQLHSQSSTGSQYITNSPNQFLMNSPTFNSQLSPLIANVSPTNQQIHSFNNGNANGQGRSNQDFLQCGQTLMVPCTIAQSPGSQNTTVVQQNTTIVQQQTTMVSSNQQQNLDQAPGPSTSASSSISLNQHNFILNNNDGKQQNFILTTDQKAPGQFILSPNPDKPGTHIILNTDKAQYGGLIISQDKPNQVCGNFIISNPNTQHSDKTSNSFIISSGNNTEKQPISRFSKHSVSTQTAANQQVLQISSTPLPTALVVATSNTFCQTSTTSSYSGSPPDTTTHSPADGGISQSPGFNSEAPSSTDDLSSPTSSSDPAGRSQPMVHCVSSSNEQDTPDWKDTAKSPGMFSPPPASDLTYIRGSRSIKNVSIGSIVESSSSPVESFDDEKLFKRNNDREIVECQIFDNSSLKRFHKHSVHFNNEAQIHTSSLSPNDEDDEAVN